MSLESSPEPRRGSGPMKTIRRVADAMSTAIKGMVDDDGGMHIVPTVGGCELEARYQGDNIMLTDQRGQTINVTIADVDQSNGVIHVVDSVILPKM